FRPVLKAPSVETPASCTTYGLRRARPQIDPDGGTAWTGVTRRSDPRTPRRRCLVSGWGVKDPDCMNRPTLDHPTGAVKYGGQVFAYRPARKALEFTLKMNSLAAYQFVG